MDAWLDEMAAALGEEPLTGSEVGLALRLARDVAHGVERKLAPLASYLAGVRAGRLKGPVGRVGRPTDRRRSGRGHAGGSLVGPASGPVRAGPRGGRRPPGSIDRSTAAPRAIRTTGQRDTRASIAPVSRSR